MSDRQGQSTAWFGLLKNTGNPVQAREVTTIEAAIVFQKDSHSAPVNSCYEADRSELREEQDRRISRQDSQGGTYRAGSVCDSEHLDAIMHPHSERESFLAWFFGPPSIIRPSITNLPKSWIIHPHSRFMLGANCFSFIILLYCVLANPFTLAFYWSTDQCFRSPTMTMDQASTSDLLRALRELPTHQ
jgi:hypothetical protein